jgi:hypothetical protein
VVADLTFVRHLINIELILNCLAGWQVHEVGGMLKGLEYKLKSESSLFRKIMSDLDEEKAKDDGGLDVRKPPLSSFFLGGGGILY